MPEPAKQSISIRETSARDDYSIFKASCAIPFVCKPYEVKNIPYYDGALGDPVLVEKAFQLGCDQVVVILTKPESELRTAEKDEKLAIYSRSLFSQLEHLHFICTHIVRTLF